MINLHGNPAAGALALVGMICLIAWPLCRTRSAMLLIQLAGIASLAGHYTLVGVNTAAAVNALGALQIAASLLAGARPDLRWIGYVLAGVMGVTAFVTWQGLPSALAAAGMALVAIGRVQADSKTMRLIVLAGGPFWFTHDLIVGSPVAVADALSLAAGLGALAWERFRVDAVPAGRSAPISWPVHAWP